MTLVVVSVYEHDLLDTGTPFAIKEKRFLAVCNPLNTSIFRPLPLSFLKFINKTASKSKQRKLVTHCF